MFHISYKMLLHHLPRWVKYLLRVSNVLYVQSQCWWGAFCQPLILCCSTSPKYEKENWKSFVMLLVNLPCFHTVLAACSNASSSILYSHKSFWKVPTHLFSKTGTTSLGTHLVDLLWNCNTPWIWPVNHVCSICQPLLSPQHNSFLFWQVQPPHLPTALWLCRLGLCPVVSAHTAHPIFKLPTPLVHLLWR
jgi:hypothetical protein